MHSMGAVEFGAYLRKTRRELDVKQADLAVRLGKSQAAVSDIERGDRADISKEEIEEILSALLEGRSEEEGNLRKIIADGMREAGFLYSAQDVPEMERIIDDEEWEVVQAYRGLEGGIKRSFRGFLLSAQEVTGDEPKEELVYGRGPHKPAK
jgi:transcriptional regulator with XRE-family HTH domain